MSTQDPTISKRSQDLRLRHKAGISATVYEARRRVGGRILSLTGAIGEGLVTDLGGSFINSNHEDMLRLIQEFGLELFNRIEDAERFAFPETGYFFDGVARSEAEVAEDLRALAAQIASDSERLDADFERFAPELDRLSVRDYLDRHAGLIPQAYIRALIESSIRTEYGVEPEESSALQLIFNLPTVDRFLRTRWSQSRFTRGAYANFKPGQLTEFGGLFWIESENAEERQEVHAGNLVFAGEHLSDAFYGFMNGAAETGRLAADFVVRRIAELTVASRREPECRVA